MNSGEIIRTLTIQTVQKSSRGEHSNHLTAHQSLGLTRIFNLFTQGNLIILFEKLGYVNVRCMVRHAAHRNWILCLFVSRGKGNLKFSRGNHGVLKKHFVEIPHAVEKYGIFITFFDFQVLLYHGGYFTHVHPTSTVKIHVQWTWLSSIFKEDIKF